MSATRFQLTGLARAGRSRRRGSRASRRGVAAVCLAACALGIATVRAPASHASTAAGRLTGPGGCKLMAAALRAVGGTWALTLTVHDYERTTDPPGAYCTWNEAAPAREFAHHLTLTFFIAPSAAAAHANVLHSMVPPEPVIVRRTGADEVHAQSVHGQGTFTHASWRKGRYWGKVLLSGPGDSGDLEDLHDFLVQFMRRLPRA